MLEKQYATTTRKPRLEQLATFRGEVTCRECGGSRLRREAGGVRVGGKTIHEITQLSVRRAKDFFDALTFPRGTARSPNRCSPRSVIDSNS